MNVKQETITPKKAMQWLQRNIRNRPLSPSTIGHYAKAMKAGAWKLNGDSIRFNGNGDLIDGQHRLHACIKSECSFPSYVVHGLDHDAFDTIDQGKKRTISDVFARDGYKHYTTLASAVRWLYQYQIGMGVRYSPLRPDEAHDLIEANPAIHTAVDLARRLCGHQKVIHTGMLAFLIYESGREKPEKAEAFWGSAVTGENTTKGDAASTLHRRLVSNLGSAAKLPANTIVALSIKAWNCHLSGKPCGILKWIESEDFPVFRHK